MTTVSQDFVEHVAGAAPNESVYDLLLDHSKISWYRKRVEAWGRGERIAPVTMDVAWTRKCQAACTFCAASTQANETARISQENAFDFLEDAAAVGVKGISLISDGESTLVPWYEESIEYAARLGIKIGLGTNGVRLKRKMLERILPHVSYLRFNFSAGDRKRYSDIMGLSGAQYDQVVQNVKDAIDIKRRDNLDVNINLQMVVAPHMNGDQIMPFATLAKELLAVKPGQTGRKADSYAILKHCADSKDGALGMDYKQYDPLFPVFRQAEALSDDTFRVVVKWSRLEDEGKRHYHRCYGPPFLLQMSGSGLLAPCGPFFNEKYKKFHFGNITRTRFKDILDSEHYWDVIRYLANDLDPSVQCGPNCVQTRTNQWLWDYKQGRVQFNNGPMPVHPEFL